MLTRAKVRHSLAWTGVGLGAAAALAYLFSLFGVLTCHASQYMLAVGDGAVTFKWRIIPMPATPTNPTPGSTRAGLFARRPTGEGWSWLPRWTESVNTAPGPVPFPGSLIIPLWIPLIIGLFAAYRLLPSGPAPGRCAKCNYDLAGTPKPDDGPIKCPECGTPTT